MARSRRIRLAWRCPYTKGRMPIMTIRDQMKRRYRATLVVVFAISGLGVIWLGYATPLNHTFRISVITGVFTANLLLFLARFKCPSCNANISATSRQMLLDSGPCACPHCGVDLNQSL